jgi:hypothetical protein
MIIMMAIATNNALQLTPKSVSAEPRSEVEHWTRLNYGVVATKARTVCLVEDYAVHTIRIQLPVPVELNITLENETAPCDAICVRLRRIVEGTQNLVSSMQSSVTEMTERIFALLPDISETPLKRKRQPRALFSFVGSISQFLFGTVTEDSLEEMKKTIADAQFIAQTSLDDVTKMRTATQQFSQITNQRLNGMHAILNEQQKSVTEVTKEIRQISQTQLMWISSLSLALNELTRFIQIHDAIFELESGVQALMYGQLTPSLIGIRELNVILANVSRVVEARGMKLCAITAKDIYEAKTYAYARHENSLYIKLLIPYTRFPPLSVYRTAVLSLPVDGPQNLVTQLQNFPKWILRDAKNTFLAHLIEPVNSPVVELSNVILHYRTNNSCVTAIVRDDANLIKQNCEFSTRKATIEPAYLKLDRSTYVLHNLTNPQISCKMADSKPISTQNCLPCKVTLACNCQINSAEVRLIAPIDCSRSVETTSTVHASYNAAILQHFYELANETLRGDHLVSPEKLRSIQPLHLPFLSDNVSHLLAADDTLSYSLAKVSQSFTNSSSIIHSPTEGILFQYMHQLTKEDAAFPNFRKIETWLILSPLPVLIFLSVAIIVLHRRIQILHAVISASALMQRTHAIELRTRSPAPITSTTQLPIVLWLEQIRQHDIVLITLIAFIIVIVIALIWAVRKALKRESWLYLDISSANRVMQLKFFQLPDSTRCFEINLPKTETQLIFRSYFFFGIIAFTTPAWRITHSLTKMQIKLPRILWVPPWKIAVIQRIFHENEFKAVPLVVHSHEYSFVRDATNLAVVGE